MGETSLKQTYKIIKVIYSSGTELTVTVAKNFQTRLSNPKLVKQNLSNLNPNQIHHKFENLSDLHPNEIQCHVHLR